ncbi:MAG: hypothetical protein FWE70_08880, partial [Oscillospiraceae bacterium]|nr:hypothetical protein [Oscillospiraceae bacterium]
MPEDAALDARRYGGGVLDRGEALEILGLPQGATKAEVDRKFSLLSKASKHTLYLDDGHEDKVRFAKAEEAYILLSRGFERESAEEAYKGLSEAERAKALRRGKAGDFLRYNRIRIAAAAIAIAVLLLVGYDVMNKGGYTLNLVMMGDVLSVNAQGSEGSLSEQMGSSERVSVFGAYIAKGLEPAFVHAERQKLVTRVSGGQADLFICDWAMFKEYDDLDAFEPIGWLFGEYDLDADRNGMFRRQGPDG